MSKQITHRYTGKVLFEAAVNTVKELLLAALSAGANLPSPTMVLLASWGSLSASLCRDLMAYDAACHPDPSAFARWACGGPCPYSDVKVQRAAVFIEQREHWDATAPMRRPFDLMVDVLAEKCPPWSEEQQKAFAEKFRRDGGTGA